MTQVGGGDRLLQSLSRLIVTKMPLHVRAYVITYPTYSVTEECALSYILAYVAYVDVSKMQTGVKAEI